MFSVGVFRVYGGPHVGALGRAGQGPLCVVCIRKGEGSKAIGRVKSKKEGGRVKSNRKGQKQKGRRAAGAACRLYRMSWGVACGVRPANHGADMFMHM